MGKKRTETAWVQSSLGRARWGYWSPKLISAFSRPGSSPTPPRSSLVPAVEKSASELFACERAWMELLALGRIPVGPSSPHLGSVSICTCEAALRASCSHLLGLQGTRF